MREEVSTKKQSFPVDLPQDLLWPEPKPSSHALQISPSSWTAWASLAFQTIRKFSEGIQPKALWDIKQTLLVASPVLNSLQLLFSSLGFQSVNAEALDDEYLSDSTTRKLQTLNCLLRALSSTPSRMFGPVEVIQEIVERLELELRQRFLLGILKWRLSKELTNQDSVLNENEKFELESDLLCALWVVNNEGGLWDELVISAKTVLENKE